ncbi:MAG: phytanoyl-CoA dioxygenase family protein [Pseudomonadota bacterium]
MSAPRAAKAVNALYPAQKKDIADSFEQDGYYFPLEVFSRDQAARYRQELGALEEKAEAYKAQGLALGNKTQLNFPHLVSRFAHEIVTHPRLLDAVEAILGPDILLWGSTFFVKAPHTESYVSWHQDLRYWGLSGEEEVSAWVALGPVNQANGCMRFVPGSHRGEMLPHKDTFDEANFLTRGQEAQTEIAEEDTVPVELAPGQASFHHGKILHASGPNRSDEKRIGFAINYISPAMRQVVAPHDFAMLVRGEDRYGHFELTPPPDADLSDQCLAWHRRVLSSQNDALYDGAEQAKMI